MDAQIHDEWEIKLGIITRKWSLFNLELIRKEFSSGTTAFSKFLLIFMMGPHKALKNCLFRSEKKLIYRKPIVLSPFVISLQRFMNHNQRNATFRFMNFSFSNRKIPKCFLSVTSFSWGISWEKASNKLTSFVLMLLLISTPNNSLIDP